jgi:uncharacterized heparinase superfamily protein
MKDEQLNKAPEGTPDDTSDDTPNDTIAPGRRLVRAGGGSGQSLGERISNALYKMTWRTPLHKMRLKGRHPLKLLTVPKDPVVGNVERGRSIIAGTIAFRAERLTVDECDFANEGLSLAFSDYLNSFAWLRDLSAAGERATTAPIAESLMKRWIEKHADQITGESWRADLWGRRMLFWAAHAPLILSSTDLVYRSTVLNAMARGARHLERVAKRAPFGVPRIVASAGICAAGLLMPGGDPRRSMGESQLAKALSSGMTGDGGTICRSPYNLADMIACLSMLAQVYEARRVPLPSSIAEALGMAVPALMGTMMGDGGLSSWQGSGGMSPDDVKAIVDGSGVRTRPQRQARDWGYQRISAGQTVLVIDSAPPPVTRIIDAGCASTLAFELSDGPHRLVVNCGGSRFLAPNMPQQLIQGLRSTAAHSTMVLADNNSTAINADGSLGKGVNEIDLERHETETGCRIEASHDGYAARFGLTHRRSIGISVDGKEVRCDDILLPSDAKKKPSAVPFALRFHLGPNVEATPTADGAGALLRITAGPLWQFRCTAGGKLSIDESLWVNGNGEIVGTQQLVLSGDSPPGGASVSWTFKRVG